MNKFWLHFTSAYGAMWFVMFAVALVSQSHIATGKLGFLGFPVIALIYAYYKKDQKTDIELENDRLFEENERLKKEIEWLTGNRTAETTGGLSINDPSTNKDS